MTPIDAASLNATQRLKAGATSAVSRAEPVRQVAGDGQQAAASEAGVAASVTTAGSSAPVDHERVAEIRKAVEEGRYPLVPAKIADAMIAAGYLLRSR